MLIYKILFHIAAFFKHIFLKLVYGRKFKCGKKVTWRRRFNVMIGSKARLEIGSSCFFNNDCSINVLNHVVIGKGSIFGENVKIYDHNHRFNDADETIKGQGYSIGETVIGEHCWIGSNVVILKGANIADNCVIGAGCVISGSIPSGSIVKAKNDYLIEQIHS